jgi:hypothetical protein
MAGMFKFMGQEKEAKGMNPKREGKAPVVHSHSKKPRRKIMPGKR